MKLNQPSLAARNALIYFILFILCLGISTVVLFSYSAKEILDLTQDRLRHSGEMVSLKFDTYLDNVQTDLDQLASSPLLLSYIDKPSTTGLESLTQEYSAFLSAKKTYFQVRLLSIDSGNELIRVERRNDSTTISDSLDLQNKRNRDYFLEIDAQDTGSIYFSKIDLNKEHGKLSQPTIPTMRIAKKLEGHLLGEVIIIVNIDLNNLFTDLRGAIPENYELRIVDHEGHYLIHPDSEKAFTFEYDRPPFYRQEFSKPFNEISNQSDIYSTDEAEHKFLQINYPRQAYDVGAVVSANKNVVFDSFYSWQKKVIWFSCGTAVLFLIAGFMYMRRQVRELKSITSKLTLFSGKPTPQKLGIDRKDEIGALALGFEEMSKRISESHQLLEKARREAELAYNEKNEFLENMSHEIRGPLQAILGTVQILNQNRVDEQQKPFIDSLAFSAEQLKSLVTDVLDYSKIKNDQIQLHPEWLNLDGFCKDLIKALDFQAVSKGISLEFIGFNDLNSSLYLVDPTRFYQILNNLIGNALKFTKNGGRVELIVSRLSQKSGQLRFEIKDTGSGISANDLVRISDRHYTSNYRTGAGLGLAIVHKLLQLYKSDLQIESDLGIGSRFFFDIELDSQTNRAQTEGKLEVLSKKFKKQPKILVLDDDVTVQHWYNFSLSDQDTTVKSDPEKLTQADRYDLIFSDLNFESHAYNVQEIGELVSTVLKEDGELIIVSGSEPKDLTGGIRFIKKPVTRGHIATFVFASVVRLNLGQPDFSNIERDYDFQKKLVKNALTILAQEWEKDSDKLAATMENQNLERFDQIHHKIITSIRRLNLERFEVYLNDLRELIVNDEPIVKSDVAAAQLKHIFSYYVQEIRDYAQKNGS